MIQCPNCGGNLVFDISSQQMMCDHRQTQFDPYTIEKLKMLRKMNSRPISSLVLSVVVKYIPQITLQLTFVATVEHLQSLHKD